MSATQATHPQQICENLLTEGIRYNIEHSVWPSENVIANRLLSRGIELKDAYEELYEKLNAHPFALKTFLQLILNTAAFWNPEKILRARADRDELVSVNLQIAKKAQELAGLLEQRSDLHNTSGFSSETHYHVCDVIKGAAKDNHLFGFYVQEPLGLLSNRFDLKYWPSLGQFLQEVADNATGAGTVATDSWTAVSTSASRPSRADYFKALFAAIEENTAENYGQLPRGFKLTDNTLASLVNVALDLGPDELVDGSYVKRFRQRERN